MNLFGRLEEHDCCQQKGHETEDKREESPGFQPALRIKSPIFGFDQPGFGPVLKCAGNVLVRGSARIDRFDHLFHQPVVPPDAGLCREEECNRFNVMRHLAGKPPYRTSAKAARKYGSKVSGWPFAFALRMASSAAGREQPRFSSAERTSRSRVL
jgi:hypothetical protein